MFIYLDLTTASPVPSFELKHITTVLLGLQPVNIATTNSLTDKAVQKNNVKACISASSAENVVVGFVNYLFVGELSTFLNTHKTF